MTDLKNSIESLDYMEGKNNSLSFADAELINKSEANLNTILDHADSGYVLYSADLKIVAYNSLAQKFSNLLYGRILVEGTHLLHYFPKDKHQYLLETTKKVLNGEDVEYEVCFIVNDFEKWLKVKWLNVKNVENRNWGFILVSQDITESKLAAKKFEKITHDLVNRNKALEQFANIISHNLRAPVANIINLVQMIDLNSKDEEAQQFLEFILSSSQALNAVIDDIHQILEVKQRFYEVKEKIDFDQLTEDIKTSINLTIIKEKVIITTDFETTPYIYSIRSFLYSVFYNLILNSIKYRRPDVVPEIYLSSKIFNHTLNAHL